MPHNVSEYYASPRTPLALSPSKRSRSLQQSRRANHGGAGGAASRLEAMTSPGADRPSRQAEAGRKRTSDLFASRNTARRAATAPPLASTLPGRYSQTNSNSTSGGKIYIHHLGSIAYQQPFISLARSRILKFRVQ
eukprot:scaffold168796_cov32-Prasinocladus_malaysianus.AAC.1